MSVVLEISLPVFGLILCGYAAGITGILGKQSAAALNGFVFYFALPALLFGFTAQAPLIVILNWNFIGSIFFGSLATYIVALIFGWSVFGFRLPIIGIAALSSVFANTGYLGIPLFLTAFGPDHAGPAIVATVTVNIVFVGGTICFLELAGNNKATPQASIEYCIILLYIIYYYIVLYSIIQDYIVLFPNQCAHCEGPSGFW